MYSLQHARRRFTSYGSNESGVLVESNQFKLRFNFPRDVKNTVQGSLAYFVPVAAVMLLTACGRSASVDPSQASALPAASLSAAPSSVASGGVSTLTWSSTNATACTASGSWSGAKATSGTQSTGALTMPSSYSLTCTGAGGSSPVATALVNIVPTATLVANPTVVASGGTSTLTWSSTNATSCTASGGWSGAKATSGTQSTGALTATTSYSLSCSGAGGTSSGVTATVTTSNGAVGVSPKIAAVVQSQTQQFTATVPGGGAATWAVDGVAGGNSTVGTISASGTSALYTAGSAVGTHTIIATSVADNTQTGSAVAAVTDLAGVYTYHNDLARDGANGHEYALTPANVNTASFGKRTSCPVDGAIYGQPLWVGNLTVGGAMHNVVFVATAHDSVFAFDADAVPCQQLWTASLLDAAHGAAAGETTVPPNLFGTTNEGSLTPEAGVTSTPVIDRANGILYAVAMSVDSTHTTYYHRLHAIDLATGAEKAGAPIAVAGAAGGTVSFDPHQQLQRAGLALLGGTVYLSFSSQEDAGTWYGWMMSYRYTTSLMQTGVFNAVPNLKSGGIWMSGSGPAADSNNNLYVLTGNGGFDPAHNDYGDSLLQLNPTLTTVLQYFTPSDQATDNASDSDFGAGGAAVLADLPAGSPVTHLIMGGGKDGAMYVLNRDKLGGLEGPANAAVQKLFMGQIFATGAFWNNYFYIAAIGGPLNAYSLNTTVPQFALASHSAITYGFPGATPSVSAAGAQSGIVWALDTNRYCTPGSSLCGPAVLHAYDATNVATELWNSTRAPAGADAAGNAVKFAVPTIANGKVYVGTRGNNTGGVFGSTSVSGELDIYGLKP